MGGRRRTQMCSVESRSGGYQAILHRSHTPFGGTRLLMATFLSFSGHGGWIEGDGLALSR
jgi:hypothetical protein